MTFADPAKAPTPRLGERIGQGCIVLVLLLVGSCTAYDYGSRYASWAGLEKPKVVAAAQWYVRERAPGKKVCLYRVTCDKGRARLVLVKDLATWDFEATRQLVWDRKFGSGCPGYTANLALEVAPGGTVPPQGMERAVWSFYLDRFRPWQTHEFSAFSEKSAEPCTPEYAIAP